MVDIENKIIITDEDTADQDGREDGGIYPLDLSNIVISMSESPYSVYEYLRRFDQKRIDTSPDFQRKLVWTKGKKCKFIESIILNFPIPPIYLNETVEGTYIVIDGVQRTTTLHDFYKNRFELTDLEALPALNGKKFNNLPSAMQAKFEDQKLNTFILKPSTPMPVIYELFNRINTGGTQLNKQEVRNCIFIGKSTKLLKELSEEKCFIDAIDGGIADTRMKDRETILRYIAFRQFDYKNDYMGSISDYVEQAMKNINKMDDFRIKEIKADFKRVMEWSYKIWGTENFRIRIQNRRGTINTAILETVCNFLSHKTDDFLKLNLPAIRKNYSALLKNNVYWDAVTKSTGNKNKVIDRFRLADEILNQNTINDLQKTDYISKIFVNTNITDVYEIQNQIDALLAHKKSIESSSENTLNENTEDFLAENDAIESTKSPGVINYQKNSYREKISVAFPDGTVIKRKNVAETFVETIKKIGVERVKELNISSSTVPIVSEIKHPKYAQHKVGKYYVMTNTNTNTKFYVLDEINKRLNLKLKILKE